MAHTSDSELDCPKGITDAASCLDYLKKKEVFLYKMMNDPSHKAMLYFLEVLMNSEAPVTIEQLAARFSHKTFSSEMREACGGGSPEGLRDFLLRYPSLFNVNANGHVSSVAIELPGKEGVCDGLQDLDCWSTHSARQSTFSNDHGIRKYKFLSFDEKPQVHNHQDLPQNNTKERSASSLSLTSATSNASGSSGSSSFYNHAKQLDRFDSSQPNENNQANNKPCRRSLYPTGTCPTSNQEHQTHSTCNAHSLRQKCCDQIGTVAIASVPATACLHCPIVELTCHHHHHAPTSCSTGSHLHHATTATTHCICANSRLTCVPFCHQCHSLSIQPSQHKTSASSANTVCALPPLEQLTLETEAVRFFQQRLLRREERWVQIKSLAGHLSQASADIRAIVGPQLEFRNFLLRHPHVFEVQGELVSVREPFGSTPQTRKDREHKIYNSASSNNLSLNGNPTYTRNIRLPRPKSLVLPDNRCSRFPALTSQAQFAEWEHERLPLFAGKSVTPNYPKEFMSANSLPNTPTGLSRSINAETPTPRHHGRQPDLFVDKSNLVSSSLESSLVERANERETGAKSTNSMSISMTANEYRSVMFIRKVLEKRGGASNQPGLPFGDLLQILSEKPPEAVRTTIGWTKVEVEEFINQHHIFFEILTKTNESSLGTKQPYDNNTCEKQAEQVVKNKRLEKMINIVITGTKPLDSSLRCLTNRCGRIFHVTKLWGIIDLGRHEHVFFDKSIFRHIDDLQKHFKVDETLYFNAVLAPKESRAKWRATQVWKECDKQTMELMKSQRATSELPQTTAYKNGTRNLGSVSSTRRECHSLKARFSECDFSNDNEDTEAECEIEEIDVDGLSVSDHPGKFAMKSGSTEDIQCEFALNGEEELEDEEPYLSKIAREEGLQLINDVKFITDTPNPSGVNSELRGLHEKNERQDLLVQPVKSNDSLREKRCDNNYENNAELKRGIMISSNEQTPSECTSSLNSGECSWENCSRHDINKSLSSAESSNISIAVQTVSTGEIMATNLYHDLNKQSCQSGC